MLSTTAPNPVAKTKRAYRTPRSRPTKTVPFTSGGELVGLRPPAAEAEEIWSNGGKVGPARLKAARHRIAQWISLRAINPSMTLKDAAASMEIDPATLRRDIQIGDKLGWLKFEDLMLRLEHGIIPKVIDNLDYFIDQRDRLVTLEVAKGLLYKTYLESKGITDAPQTVLALKIEMPEVGNERIVTGHIIGVPKPV